MAKAKSSSKGRGGGGGKARSYKRDNMGRFSSTGATARGGRLKTAGGKKRATETAKIASKKPAGVVGKNGATKPAGKKGPMFDPKAVARSKRANANSLLAAKHEADGPNSKMSRKASTARRAQQIYNGKVDPKAKTAARLTKTSSPEVLRARMKKMKDNSASKPANSVAKSPRQLTGDQKIARDVMTDKRFRSDKQRIAEMTKRGIKPGTDIGGLVAGVRAKQGGGTAARIKPAAAKPAVKKAAVGDVAARRRANSVAKGNLIKTTDADRRSREQSLATAKRRLSEMERSGSGRNSLTASNSALLGQRAHVAALSKPMPEYRKPNRSDVVARNRDALATRRAERRNARVVAEHKARVAAASKPATKRAAKTEGQVLQQADRVMGKLAKRQAAVQVDKVGLNEGLRQVRRNNARAGSVRSSLASRGLLGKYQKLTASADPIHMTPAGKGIKRRAKR